VKRRAKYYNKKLTFSYFVKYHSDSFKVPEDQGEGIKLVNSDSANMIKNSKFLKSKNSLVKLADLDKSILYKHTFGLVTSIFSVSKLTLSAKQYYNESGGRLVIQGNADLKAKNGKTDFMVVVLNSSLIFEVFDLTSEEKDNVRQFLENNIGLEIKIKNGNIADFDRKKVMGDEEKMIYSYFTRIP